MKPHGPLPSAPNTGASQRSRSHGVTLVELMIALAFGLVLILATLSIYMANRQTFNQVENLARLNENARIAFDLLGRDFRETGATPCDGGAITVVLNKPSLTNWGGTQRGITPYGKTQALPNRSFGSAAAQRVNNTDAIVLTNASDDQGVIAASHDTNLAVVTLNKIGPGFALNDLVLVCSATKGFATLFQVTNDATNSTTLKHEKTISTESGNYTKALYKSGEAISPLTVGGDSVAGANISKVNTVTWYIANNGRGGRSLYRVVNANSPEEMVENIANMEIEYLVFDGINTDPFDYVISTNYATTVPRPKGVTSGTYAWWPDSFKITAARITLSLQTPGRVGTDGQVITRQVTTVFSLRNQIF
jgi:type IV pilus assembly protein PilW